jgi:hypothetical protein
MASVWQAGDGKRYAINLGVWLQTCASAAALDAKNKFSKLESVGKVMGRDFQCVGYDAHAADAYRKRMFTYHYDLLWRVFQSPGADRGEAVVAELARMREMSKRWSESLERKFSSVSDLNKASLGALDNQLLAAQVTRDVGFTVVLTVSSGGLGAAGGLATGTRAIIAGASIVTKTGCKLHEVRSTVTDKQELTNKQASIMVGAASDVVFSAVALGGLPLSATDTFIVAASIKAPTEACKAALDGATPSQMALAVGFELFAPFLEGAGGALAKKLFPRFGTAALAKTTEGVGAMVANAAATVGKDGWALPILGASAQGGSALSRLVDLLSVPNLINISPAMYYRMYAIRPVTGAR